MVEQLPVVERVPRFGARNRCPPSGTVRRLGGTSRRLVVGLEVEWRALRRAVAGSSCRLRVQRVEPADVQLADEQPARTGGRTARTRYSALKSGGRRTAGALIVK